MRPTRRTFLKLTGAAAASLYTTRGFGQEGEEAATRSVIWYIDIEHQKSASQGDFAIKRGAIEEAAPGCSVNYVWYGDVVSNPSSLESMKAGNVLAAPVALARSRDGPSRAPPGRGVRARRRTG